MKGRRDLSSQPSERYQIERLLRHGGMATIYLATDKRFNRKVALKVLPTRLLQEPTFLERFDREIKVLGQLDNHPHVVPVHDHGLLENDQPFIAMRYMAGDSLKQKVQRDGRLSLLEASEVIATVAGVLDYAHSKNIVHRDVKPSNILCDDFGTIYLSDFGLAKILDTTEDLTGSDVRGTSQIIAPEMVRGGNITPQVDIYMLGVTLFNLLTGQWPYDADTSIARTTAHLILPVPNICEVNPELPASMNDFVQQAMAKKPAERFPSAGALADALQRVVDEHRTQQNQPTVNKEEQPLIVPSFGTDASGKLNQQKLLPENLWQRFRNYLDPADQINYRTVVLEYLLEISGNDEDHWYRSLWNESSVSRWLARKREGLSHIEYRVYESAMQAWLGYGSQRGLARKAEDYIRLLRKHNPVNFVIGVGIAAVLTIASVLGVPNDVIGALSRPARQAESLVESTTTATTNTLEQPAVTQQVILPTEEPTERPTEAPTPTPTSDPPTPTSEPPTPTTVLTLPGPPGGRLAGEKVTSNDAWTPYTKEINGVEMALVPAGCFEMGSEDGNSDESPVHEVCFEEPFWIDVYEVTNEQYGSTGCESYSSEPDQPRNCVNWTDSLAHCEARGARLPTEAEWEYAARGPDGLVYPWGNDFVADNVVYSGNSGSRTRDVGSNPGGVSWIGAYDLSGNVWEWVNDWYDPDYYETLANGGVNPTGPDEEQYRVLRGGSWDDGSSLYLRGAVRVRGYPSDGGSGLGFRCALSY